MLHYVLTGGFDYVPTDEEIDSGNFALSLLNRLNSDPWMVEAWLYDALMTGDREKLVPYTKERTVAANLTEPQMKALLKIGHPSFLRESLKQLQARFKFHRGPTPKLPIDDYSKALTKAELIRPVIEKLLNELAAPTTHTVPEILRYYRKDHPEACEFLLRYVQRLEQALNDERLLRRAKKRLSARARVVADSMAGTEYELSFSTSLEYVRTARRRPSSHNSR